MNGSLLMYYFSLYLSKRYRSDLSNEKIVSKLKSITTEADWKLNLKYFTRQVSHKILEGECYNNSFLIVNTKYGLTFGRTSLFPTLKGKLEYDVESNKSVVNIEIRPFYTGLIIIGLVFCLSLLVLYLQFKKGSTGQGILTCFFILIIYLSIITQFSKEVKNYLQIIESSLY